jgi:hypothetical protein
LLLWTLNVLHRLLSGPPTADAVCIMLGLRASRNFPVRIHMEKCDHNIVLLPKKANHQNSFQGDWVVTLQFCSTHHHPFVLP